MGLNLKDFSDYIKESIDEIKEVLVDLGLSRDNMGGERLLRFWDCGL